MSDSYPVFLKKEKVRDRQGNIWTVLDQIGNQVYVYENPLVWLHPDKLTRVDPPKVAVDEFRNMRGRPGGKV